VPREVDMVGMDGVLHTYPEWFYLLLKGMNRQLVRSNAAPILGRTGDRRHLTILPLAVAVLRPLLEDVPHYSPVRRVKAFNPGFRSGRGRTAADDAGFWTCLSAASTMPWPAATSTSARKTSSTRASRKSIAALSWKKPA
jgi:hypothetical protein